MRLILMGAPKRCAEGEGRVKSLEVSSSDTAASVTFLCVRNNENFLEGPNVERSTGSGLRWRSQT
jgi:hypothetical protein